MFLIIELDILLEKDIHKKNLVNRRNGIYLGNINIMRVADISDN